MARGEVYAVIGWNFDRLFRRPAELETFLDLCDRLRFTRAVTAQGDVDLTTDDGRLHARIMVAVAAKESDDKSRRMKRALQDRRERGQHHHGRAVYGYRMVDGMPIIVAEQAAIVQDAARRFLAGEPLTSIARSMPPDAPQTNSGVRLMLLSPALTGRVGNSHTGAISGVAPQWAPILDDTTAAEIRSVLKAPDRVHTAPSGQRRWWLAGLVTCALCGNNMRAQQGGGSSGPTRSFTCNKLEGGCGKMSIRAELLQWHVEIGILDSVVVKEPVDRAPVIADGLIDGHTERLADLAAMYASGGITRDEWVAAREAARKLSGHGDVMPAVTLRPVVDLAKRWRGMTVDERHEQATRLIEKVVIHPRVHGGPRNQLVPWVDVDGVERSRVKVKWRA